jgi:2-polyprenyl-3-methyl-5-hydroxy-6-metoxy-1,4-benzoquinol methylase
MRAIVDEFIACVSKKSELQKKYLKQWNVTVEERNELNIVLNFFLEECECDIDYMAEAYLFINNMVLEETYYFVVHGKYRYSTFEEVNSIVYDSQKYMEKYMMGLAISDYIWVNHIKMLRYFSDNYSKFCGENYLEIGPGYGQYLVRALLNCKFNKYVACDISKTSVDGSNKYLKYRNLDDKCVVVNRDFFEFDSDDIYDCIVMGEVLEHVEEPVKMLKRLHILLSDNGRAFITTVINAPTIDHISLFTSINEVLNMVEGADFTVVDYMCATAGDIPLEKAVKKNKAINIAMILRK